ncbi:MULTISPECIES: MarR family transcriptional regulator [Burkholderia cepacia complex]|uniref:Helix-turn-helix domain-containing protein n=1 Tax=Burkholderia metallica TaxID=488729 RepID=A0ABT8PJ54_9BURK|nr:MULTISPECIES: helix-turn-helix domain-containing protein [Burkholderia cepacia complex]MCA8031990.1 MarR family transcriptional regulator [Burkholderia arboris]MDN7935160.1 helix-turn-helix domain-containing protein [Burkholderia metallica]
MTTQTVKRRTDRKPVHLEMAGGKTQRQRVWETLRAANGALTMTALSRTCKVESSTIHTYMHGLIAAGYVESTDGEARGAVTEKYYRLVRDCGLEAPRVTRDGKPVTMGLGHEQMWRAMRIIGEFDFRILAARASTRVAPVSAANAKAYVTALAAAGYLRCVQPAKHRIAARYVLVPGKYTGPRPPMLRRVNQVFDPNTVEVVWTEPKGIDDEE